MLPCVGEFILQIGNGGGVSACGHWHTAALRPRRLAVLRFRGFPAYCAAPSHVALPVPEGPLITYHIVRAVVQHSKTAGLMSESGQKRYSIFSALCQLPPGADNARPPGTNGGACAMQS